MTVYALSKERTAEPDADIEPPDTVTVLLLYSVILPSVITSEPEARLSELRTQIFAAVPTLAPVEVKWSVHTEPVKEKPVVRPSDMLSTSIVPVPDSAPDVITSAVLPDDISVPSTLSDEVPENTASASSVTSIPAGMIMTSELSNEPGMRPPQVSAEEKLPEATAVKIVAFAVFENAIAAQAVSSKDRSVVLSFLIVSDFDCSGKRSSKIEPITRVGTKKNERRDGINIFVKTLN